MKGAMQYSTKGVNNDYVLCVSGYLPLHITYSYLPKVLPTTSYVTVTLHNLFTLYTFDNIGTGLGKVRIGKGGYLNVPYDTG